MTKEKNAQELGKNEYCNQCSCFELLPDSDPEDLFNKGKKKAVCTEMKAVIEESLEYSFEWNNIRKPLYCPKLGRALTTEEKKKAARMLRWAKSMMV